MKIFTDIFNNRDRIMMEGAIGERLKREYGIALDENVVMGKLVREESGREALKDIWRKYYLVAKKYELPFMATTTTRRLNIERAESAGLAQDIVADNIKFLNSVRDDLSNGNDFFIGYMVGCKGDAYTAEGCLSREQSSEFHRWELEAALKENIDFVYAALMPSLDEALGIADIISKSDVPYIISFTIQGDGKLIDGTKIDEAIKIMDREVSRAPLCYMTNCVHPSIVLDALNKNDAELIKKRFLGIQMNTSKLPYSQMDNSKVLLAESSRLLAKSTKTLDDSFPMKIVGGCCGTDEVYMDEILGALSR